MTALLAVRAKRSAGGGAGEWTLFERLAPGAFAMRSAGCVYNDIVDRNLDRQVERPRLRLNLRRRQKGSAVVIAPVDPICAS